MPTRFFRHPETVPGSDPDDDFLEAADDPREEHPAEEDSLENSPEAWVFPHDA